MTAALFTPVPVLGWEAPRPEWLAARRKGLGASDVAAVLGFSRYATPWQVWAEKLNVRRPDDAPSEAAELGTDLEPWLLERASRLVGQPVCRTGAQLYRHPDYPWRMCSPDGRTVADGTGIQCKTAGLVSGYGPPKGWNDGGTPLGYELQCRWECHVMGWERVELVALVANTGLVRRTIVRDLAVEADLVAQVTEWYERHIVGREEPPLGAPDNDVMAELYPATTGESVDLPDSAIELWFAYRDGRDREKAARQDRETAGAALKQLMGVAQFGRVGDQLICTWGEKAGQVDWARLVADLAETAGVPAPNPELYRKPTTRCLSVKD